MSFQFHWKKEEKKNNSTRRRKTAFDLLMLFALIVKHFTLCISPNLDSGYRHLGHHIDICVLCLVLQKQGQREKKNESKKRWIVHWTSEEDEKNDVTGQFNLNANTFIQNFWPATIANNIGQCLTTTFFESIKKKAQSQVATQKYF